MVTVKGRMAVNLVNGRKGQFRVATLYSEIGDFVLHYDGLDQFDPGTYEGKFVVRDTAVRVRVFGVGKIIEPIAFVEDMKLDNADEGLREEMPDAIPDPAEEEAQSSKSDLPDFSDKSPSELTEQDLKDLFGSLWPLGQQVELDPTVGRPVLRAQANYLKSMGYKYVAAEKTWFKRH